MSTPTEAKLIADRIIEGMRDLYQRDEPKAAQSYFTAIIGLVAGRLGDDTWQRLRFMASTPCGHLNCDCHLNSRALWEVMDEKRDNLISTGITTPDIEL